MRIEKDQIVIRSAEVSDAQVLTGWWNDGNVMEHAGYPDGLGLTMEDTIQSIKGWEGKLSQLCIIEVDGIPVGELNYRLSEDGIVYPGWKICDPKYQNRGIGPKVINMLFQFLFTDPAINASIAPHRIVWDTMLENVQAQHVYEKKIGARRVRVVENAWQDQIGNWRNSVEYEIDRNTFFDGSDSPD